jgi:hypothetical protein
VGKGQIIIRTENGDTDLFYYLEQLEKRLASLEEQVRNLQEWKPQVDLEEVKPHG